MNVSHHRFGGMPRVLQKSLAYFLCLMVLLNLSSLQAQKLEAYKGPMPIPVKNPRMLFYLQRTLDVRTLIYEANYTATGLLDAKKPVRIYWIDYTKGGKTSELSTLQNAFAYGIESVKLEGPEPAFIINLVSFKTIKMHLKPSGINKQYQAHVHINGKACVLNNVLVHIVGGTYLKPEISHVELRGCDPETGQLLTQRIKP